MCLPPAAAPASLPPKPPPPPSLPMLFVHRPSTDRANSDPLSTPAHYRPVSFPSMPNRVGRQWPPVRAPSRTPPRAIVYTATCLHMCRGATARCVTLCAASSRAARAQRWLDPNCLFLVHRRTVAPSCRSCPMVSAESLELEHVPAHAALFGDQLAACRADGVHCIGSSTVPDRGLYWCRATTSLPPSFPNTVLPHLRTRRT